MTVAIHGLQVKEGQEKIFQFLFAYLNEHQVESIIYAPLKEQLLRNGLEIAQLPTYSNSSELRTARFMLCIGGDGTILDAVTFVKSKGIPIFGINSGRLGFLSGVNENDEISIALNMLFTKNYVLEERALLRLETSKPCFEDASFALNECAILKSDNASMITIHTSLNGEFISSFWADGLLISTPTGSTGYNLSCGGPVVMPQSEDFIITPVCPHNLNVRPLVIPNNAKVSVKVESRSENFLLSLDSRSKVVNTSTELVLRKEDFKINLLKIKGNSFTSTLRDKLHWGLDSRN